VITTQYRKEEFKLIEQARAGSQTAYNALIARYEGFVRLKVKSYFMAGGDSDDLIQEGLIGLFKAIHDFRDDRGSSFRSFAELCITRQIITAIKSATRKKHGPLNNYISLYGSPKRFEDGELILADLLGGPEKYEPFSRLVSATEIEKLVFYLGNRLSGLEAGVLKLSLEGLSYEQIGAELECDTKSVDNALQRIRRKVHLHMQASDE